MNEDNVLVRNVLVEFEDSLKYVSIIFSTYPQHAHILTGYEQCNYAALVYGTDSTGSLGNASQLV